MPAAAYLATSVPLRLASAGTAAALPILAVQQLHDVTIGGLLVGVSLAPAILVAPGVGVALDRARHPRLLIVAAGVVSAVAFAVAAFLGPLPPLLVGAVLAISGAATPFYFGGLSSFVSQIAANEARGYAADALSYNIGSVAGPALAAVAVAAGSARAAMLVLAGCALLGACGGLSLRVAPHAAPDGERPRVLRQVADGLRYLARHRPIAVVTGSGTLSQLGAGALPIVAVALAAQRTGSADHAAWFVTAFAVGALVGTLAATAWPAERIRPQWTMGAGFAATGILLLAAAPDVGFVPTLVLIAISGLFTAHSTAAMLLLRKQQSPARLRSQVFTVGAGLRSTAAAVGAALAGLAAGASAESQLAAIGILWVLSGAALLLYPRGAEPVDA